MKPIPVFKHDFSYQRLLPYNRLYLYLNIGSLIDSINQQIIFLPQIVQLNTGLVNVAFPRKQFQSGFLEFPDLQKSLGFWPEFAVTFATNGDYFPQNEIKSIHVTKIRRRVLKLDIEYKFSLDNTATQFIVVLFDSTDSQRFNFLKVNERLLAYIFDVLGFVYKNVFKFRPLFKNQTLYSTRTLNQLAVDLNTGLGSLQNIPMFDWPLNHGFWSKFPHFIPPSFLSHYTIYYYLKLVHPYIKDAVFRDTRNFSPYTRKTLGLMYGHDSMLKYLIESVLINGDSEMLSEDPGYIEGHKMSAGGLKINANSADDAKEQIILKLWS